MSDIAPTRSALLELMDERRAMKEGYAFLDEKRLLLAGEMLRQLDVYQRVNGEFLALWQEATEALRGVIGRHGLEGTECLPAESLEDANIAVSAANLLGVLLYTAKLVARQSNEPIGPSTSSPSPPVSPEASHCRSMFARLIEQAAALAAISGNLERLLREYRHTERRARALEDVLLPEIDQTIQQVEAALEDLDREESIRTRVHSARGELR